MLKTLPLITPLSRHQRKTSSFIPC